MRHTTLFTLLLAGLAAGCGGSPAAPVPAATGKVELGRVERPPPIPPPPRR